ncbi:MAG: flagellar hook-associated protein FlgK [Acidobacteriota bacterium]
MSGLFHTLSSVSRTLEAQRFGLEVTGQNIANVNTPGYSRREVVFDSVAPVSALDGGGGVRVSTVQAARSRALERRVMVERPIEQREAAIAEALSVVEVAVGQPGRSLDARLSAFFDAASDLSADPTSAVARQQFITRGAELASAFHDTAGRLEEVQRDADGQVRALVGEVNSLSQRIADLNAQIGALPPGDRSAVALRDQQKLAVGRLAELVNVAMIDRSDGGVDVTIAEGRSLVIGATSYGVEATSVGPAGMADLRLGPYTITSNVTGGEVGGLLHVRDALVPDYRNRLDALAYGVVTEVNTIHTSGFDLDTQPAGAFFVPLAAAPAAAASIAVHPDVAADPSRVAAAGVPSTADNQVARSIASLRDARVMDGGRASLTDVWSQLVYRVGADARAARDQRESRHAILQQVEALDEAVSGVSLDEEAMMMLRYQRAYEANARFFQVINETIEMLLSMAGR